MKRFFLAATLALLAIPSNAQTKAAPCDRACLTKLVDTYLNAVVAHDSSKVNFAANAKFVENTIPMKPGEGLWKTATAVPTAFKIYVPDPTAQQVGFLGMMKNNGMDIELGLRLKLQNGQIVEAEHLIAGIMGNNLRNLQTPRPAFSATVPPDQRTPRDQMLKIGWSYYEALTTSNGKAAPFAEDCLRRENGMQTTNNPPPATPGRGSTGAMGCADQLDSGAMSYIKRIEPRRVEIADVETGLVFGLSQFRHPMDEKFVAIKNVPGFTKQDMTFAAFDLPAAHIFKVYGGKLHEIEATGFSRPYNSKTGWE